MKEITAGLIFFTIWIGVLLFWSYPNTKDVRDYSNPATDQPCRINGHPLWNEC